ncbi:toll-like receptor 8b [Triplophysa rosa]|uniref:Toll-like receptor 8 n=1 Tax=Triplophysa rosa TaxID=992332 RepID=A0A977J5N5_TRIRA|nr:toll-like receptor 8b [Triplophysa rosa]KAI7793460.1 putative toll-like receptor 8 [Triplophysa rosa]UWV86658.1 Toll-like receptor 8.2 [Triplophysa rosa]
MMFVLMLMYSVCSSDGLSWAWRKLPCDVMFSNRSVLMDCSGRSLKEIPKNLLWNSTELIFSHNEIRTLPKDAFWNLTNVTRINLRKNLLQLKKDSRVFSRLAQLKTLQLDNNNISAFPRDLPPGLQTLSLNSNHIQNIGPLHFEGMTKLEVLKLNENCYRSVKCKIIIHNKTFRNVHLTVLELSKNRLQKIPPGLPRSLQNLSLLLNRIEYIDAFVLQNQTNLRLLDLSGNCPFCFNAPFQCTPCQTANRSLEIHSDAFSGLVQLQDLRLSGNSLTTINPSWFQNLTTLKYLYLSFNSLVREFESGQFFSVLPRVEIVDFSYNNPSQTIYQRLKLSTGFSSLKSLQTLHLEGYIFSNLCEEDLVPLFALKNLSVLNLGVNFLQNVNLSVFRNFQNLSLISLSDNRLMFTGHTRMRCKRQGLSYQDQDDHREGPYIHTDQEFRRYPPFTKHECLMTGPVLDLSSNSIFHINPLYFTGAEDVTCLNLSFNFIASYFNGTEFNHFPKLKYLDLSNNRVYMHSQLAFRELKELEVLDLSHNKHYFEVAGVRHSLAFLKNLEFLRVLNLSWNEINTLTNKTLDSASLNELQFQGNRLDIMWRKNQEFKNLFKNLSNLTRLDISYNKLCQIPEDIFSCFPQTLTYLSVSRNTLTYFEWEQLRYLPRLEVLDLSKNKLTQVTEKLSKHTSSLKVLDLSSNLIARLKPSFLQDDRSLLTLNLAFNRLTQVSDASLSSGSGHSLRLLHLERNPIHCTCDLLDFILWLKKSDTVLPHLATDVLCDLPEAKRGHPMVDLDIENACINNIIAQILYVLTSSIIIIMLSAIITVHMFYWDISYIYNFCRAKIKSHHSNADCTYDAFVIYDTSDSAVEEWVFNHLCFELEERGGRVHPLCLAERDWTPGTSVMDNLNHSVHRSRKSIFVMTEGLVRSGIFKMAAFLAQQRLLEEGVDVMVLVLLEPVLRRSRILNLRRCLCGHSVLEWPGNPAAKDWFWQNLRNAIRFECHGVQSKIFTNYFSGR